MKPKKTLHELQRLWILTTGSLRSFKKIPPRIKKLWFVRTKEVFNFLFIQRKKFRNFLTKFFSSTLGHIFVSSSCRSPGKGDTRQKVNDYDDDDTDHIPRILWSELLFVGYLATPIHPSIDKEKNLSSYPTELKSFLICWNKSSTSVFLAVPGQARQIFANSPRSRAGTGSTRKGGRH